MILDVDLELKLRKYTSIKHFMSQMNPKKFLHNTTFKKSSKSFIDILYLSACLRVLRSSYETKIIREKWKP